MNAASNGQVLKLYPNVIPVRGYNRSLLVDLQKAKSHLVPNDLIDFLEQDISAVEEYENFIIENELGIFIDREIGACLTPLPTDYYPASAINNAILELNENSSWSLPSVLNQLDELGAQFLEVRFLDFYSVVKNLRILQFYSNETTIESIQIMVPFHKDLKAYLDSSLNERFFRLSTILIYNASEGFELDVNFYKLVFTRQEAVSHEHCGNISMHHFRQNTQSYVRGQNYNSCLAHKISVDRNGFIGNCPSMHETFGHVDDKSFAEVLQEKKLQMKWQLTKDKISICSVCEFRTICSDCRAFTMENTENGKPSKCGYNPFISLWKGEENYLSEQDCGIRIENGNISIPEEKINEINARIWG
ncbi:grasp-with-spasm system SPASM domain peptide maturase [Fluviicola sp.]|uniref:grasp-with-spasm system SPASM domain peptide maturase n=1 Tax=Fluviicola sp. TaxID=1917219 RepID=UPI003D2D3795